MSEARPCVLRGGVAHWPAVKAARQSAAALRAYIAEFDCGTPAVAFVGPPTIEGRFSYTPDLRTFNFERRPQKVSETLDQLIELRGADQPHALYVGSALMRDHLPGFEAENPLTLVDFDIPPRLWIGNANRIDAHFDLSDNIACVVAGRRRFTLFPPEQVANLYVGPFDYTIAGQPSSLVAIDDPDLERFPRFATALSQAQTAVLEPGDAIYIPSLWWHAVHALEPINMLVNYWWTDPPGSDAAFEALVHAIMGVRNLPETRRNAWRAFFDHYVFQHGPEAVAHLPPHARGILGPEAPELRQRMRMFLLRALNRS